MLKIDAVITWVDGNTPELRAKRIKYSHKENYISSDCARESLFSNLGEIFWCVASMNKYAPWLNKIYIVTDGQDPGLDSFLEKHFPNGHIPVEIVDHKVIFREYEEFLPTFNSISIETMTWRIPGLSEHYIEFNDDFLLINPVTPDDFFLKDGTLVCYATKYNQILASFTRKIKRHVNGRKKMTYKGVMLNAARLAGDHFSFLKINHTPRALSRSFYEDYFNSHPELLRSNISYRFRNASQFTPEELQYITKYHNCDCILRKVNDNLFFLDTKNSNRYIRRKLEHLNCSNFYKFLCINSLSVADTEGRDRVAGWVKHRLEIN